MTLSSIHNYKISSVYYRIRQHIRKKANCFLSRWNSGKKRVCQCRRLKRCGFDSWVRKIPQSRKWQPTPVFLPRKFHGQRNLVGYCPWGHKEWDTTERLTQAKIRKGTHGILLVANDNHEFRHFQGYFHFHLGFSLSLSSFSLVETRLFLYVGLKVENTLSGGWNHITSHFQNQRRMRVLPFCSY